MSTRKELDLHIRQGSTILINFPEQETPIKTQILGFSKDEFLLIRFPYIPGIRDKIQVGRGVVIRYLYEGTIFGFQAYILNSVTKPVPLLFLDYPGSVEVYDLRQYKRIQCQLPARVYIKDEELEGMILDLSHGGCKVYMQDLRASTIKEIQIDEYIALKFFTYPDMQEVQLMGYVKNKSLDKNNITLGLKFETSEEALSPVARFLEKMGKFEIPVS